VLSVFDVLWDLYIVWVNSLREGLACFMASYLGNSDSGCSPRINYHSDTLAVGLTICDPHCGHDIALPIIHTGVQSAGCAMNISQLPSKSFGKLIYFALCCLSCKLRCFIRWQVEHSCYPNPVKHKVSSIIFLMPFATGRTP